MDTTIFDADKAKQRSAQLKTLLAAKRKARDEDLLKDNAEIKVLNTERLCLERHLKADVTTPRTKKGEGKGEAAE
jgi:hypothetical protein